MPGQPTVWGFNSRRIAEEAARRANIPLAQSAHGLQIPHVQSRALPTYFVETKEEITAATEFPVITPGTGIAYLIARTLATGHPLDYVLNSEGNTDTKIEVRIFNPLKRKIPAERRMLVTMDMGGDLWIPEWRPLKIYGKTADSVTYGDSVTVNLWYWNGSAYAVTSPLLTETVWFDWMGVTGQVIASGTKVEADWWDDRNAYRISNSNCVAS